MNVIKDGIHDIRDQTISKTVITSPDNNDQQIGQTLQQIQIYLERINTPQLDTAVIEKKGTRKVQGVPQSQ